MKPENKKASLFLNLTADIFYEFVMWLRRSMKMYTVFDDGLSPFGNSWKLVQPCANSWWWPHMQGTPKEHVPLFLIRQKRYSISVMVCLALFYELGAWSVVLGNQIYLYDGLFFIPSTGLQCSCRLKVICFLLLLHYIRFFIIFTAR